MQAWKRLALKRTGQPRHTDDTQVLDALVRLEVDRGEQVLRLRDDLTMCLHALVANGVVTCDESSKAIRGLSLVVQILRTEVADKYRERAEGLQDEVDELDDQRQPESIYRDPKDRG